jgi:hypothetical protein
MLQVLEPPTQVSIYHDPVAKKDYARGFLISTKRSLPAPEGEFQISRETGHEMVQSFLNSHFMIDPQLLDRQDDGHFYGHGLDNLLRGYQKKSHGVIEKLYGPFYYPDNSGHYWYEFGMAMRDSGATATLQEYGARSWEPFSVSPHIWDYPELGQNPLDLKKWRGVGVALVMKGAFGPQAVISRLCKGDSDICYSDKGLGATLKQKCEAGCQCQVCKNEDRYIVQLLTSHLGKTGFQDSSRLEPNNNQHLDNDASKSIVPTPTNATQDPQKYIIDGKIVTESEYSLHQEIAKLRETAQAEAEAKWKSEVDALRDESKFNSLKEVFSKEIIADDAVRNATMDKYMKLSLAEVKNIKQAVDDFKTHFEPAIRAKLKAEVERPSRDDDDDVPNDDPNNPSEQKAAEKGKDKKSGKSASEQQQQGLPAEPRTTKHPLPKDEESAPNHGKSGSSSGQINKLQRLRSNIQRRIP